MNDWAELYRNYPQLKDEFDKYRYCERERQMTSSAVELVKVLREDYKEAFGAHPAERVGVQLAILDVLVGIQEILNTKFGGSAEFPSEAEHEPD